MDTYFGDDEGRIRVETLSEGAAVRGSLRGARGLVASEPQAESRLGCVGLPVFPPLQGRTSMMVVLNERAQARNLGGTAKAAFRPKAGARGCFFNVRRN